MMMMMMIIIYGMPAAYYKSLRCTKDKTRC